MLSLRNVNHFFIKQPQWRAMRRWRLNSIPPRVLDWLTEPYSLTLKIKKTFVQPFNVQLQGQGLSKPFLADSRCLQQHICHHALIRETLLKVGDEAVVFARTTLPRKVARELQELTHLGTKPLGEVIFSYLDLQRVGLDFAKIKVDHLSPLMQQQLVGESYIWARRNTYRVNKQAFIVSEFFLPAIFSK